MLFEFGREEADKYGAIIKEKLSGTVISKRICDDGKPGSLRYEAEKLNIEGFDHFTLLQALEGMIRKSMVKEVDDSHYLVL
ncbi:hypothetical protein bpr_II200 (plasmid) [Butyrivibrio proteoclasticus B316]|uniref:Uncharacterized protein n=1 Tax=Butyrivibrio proteoclasticus (strain ATCC 51982 / DSM 14932 / B316) TaxID=515622 RepID=E0S406_BUTPB|nr:hypothetical protein [Butyrivibrio proteoclasticus]ADL36138.1 hypothetical protein bpr_II200 [Butyrivibrio proteoclasticus B316]